MLVALGRPFIGALGVSATWPGMILVLWFTATVGKSGCRYHFTSWKKSCALTTCMSDLSNYCIKHLIFSLAAKTLHCQVLFKKQSWLPQSNDCVCASECWTVVAPNVAHSQTTTLYSTVILPWLHLFILFTLKFRIGAQMLYLCIFQTRQRSVCL